MRVRQNGEIAVVYVKNGDVRYILGIANLPRFLVRDDLKSKQLVEVLPDWPPRKGEIHQLYASNEHLAPRVRALIALFVQRFTEARTPK